MDYPKKKNNIIIVGHERRHGKEKLEKLKK